MHMPRPTRVESAMKKVFIGDASAELPPICAVAHLQRTEKTGARSLIAN
jgi:hypothetical protein